MATVAYGLTIKKSGGTNIAEITSIDGPNVERDMIEVTNLSSPNQAKEYLAGLIDAGEISLEVNYAPQNATHKLLIAELQQASSTAASTYVLTLTDAGPSTISVACLVKSFKLKGAVADKLAATFVLKGTGPVTFPT